MQKQAHQIYSFDEFTLDLTRGCLLHQTEEIKLRPKSFEVLKFLVENGGRLITKDEIIEIIWQGMAVTDDSLVQCLKDIRRALDDKAQEIIKTVPRRGYIFEKEVSENDAADYTEETADIHLVIEEAEDERGDNFIVPRKLPKATTLFGREKEVVGIKNLLRRDDVRIATLTGTGGTGKTRLAEAIVDDCFWEFPDGVFFVELAAINDAELVVSTIANTLGVKESGGKTLVGNLMNFLREKRLLLVLDNFEQVISAASLLTKLTDALPKLKILATSRVALRLSGEHELIVSPLAVPPTDSRIQIAELKNYSAVKLFIARAQSTKPNFIFDNNNSLVIAEICARLDGLPLAIELAAARIKLLSPPAILGRLENSLKLLTSRTPDLPARQQTMRGVVEWSYDLLDVDEKFLFNRLAVFVGGFTVEAVESVVSSQLSLADDEETSSNEKLTTNNGQLTVAVLDLLTSLIDKNLLVAKEQTDGETRLRMLETIREFALEKLETSGKLETLQRRHAEYFLALAEEADPHLQTANAGEWLNHLEAEYDNLRAAIRWLFETDAEAAARLAAAMRGFWIFHNYLTEGRALLEAALEGASSAVSFKLLNGIGMLAKFQGDYAASQQTYQKGLAAGKAANDLRQIALANRGLGAAAQLQGDYAAARKFMEEGLAISRELGDQAGIANSLNFLGDLARQENDDAVARLLFEESLTIYRQLGNKQNVCANLNNLGAIIYSEGDFAAAHSNFTEALKTAQESSYQIVISYSLEGFAALAAERKEWKMSAQLAGAAEQMRETIGYETETPDRAFRQKYIEKVRAALGETAFAETIQAGRLLKLNEAVALAERSKTDFADASEAQANFVAGNSFYTEESSGIHLVIEETEWKRGEKEKRRKGDFLDAVKQNKRTAIFALALLIVIATAFAAWRFNSKRVENSPPLSASLFQNAEVKNITHVGNIINTAISPDGKMAVYTTGDAGRESLWLRQIATDSTQQIIASANARYFGVSFSPDGNYIYYLRSENSNPLPRVLYRVAALGGVPQKLLTHLDWCPTFSPDGSRISFVRYSESRNESALMIANADGTNEQKIAVRPYNEPYTYPAWSPDGQIIAASAGSVELGDSFREVVAVNLADGTEKTLTTRKWYWIDKIAWLADSSGLMMSANPQKSHVHNQLWVLSYPNGEARQITNDSHNYTNVSLTADSRTLLAAHTELLTHLWLAPAGDAVLVRFGQLQAYSLDT